MSDDTKNLSTEGIERRGKEPALVTLKLTLYNHLCSFSFMITELVTVWRSSSTDHHYLSFQSLVNLYLPHFLCEGQPTRFSKQLQVFLWPRFLNFTRCLFLKCLAPSSHYQPQDYGSRLTALSKLAMLAVSALGTHWPSRCSNLWGCLRLLAAGRKAGR